MPFKTSPWSWLLLIVLSSLGLAMWNYSGIILSDEYLYTERAWALANETFELTPSAFDNRFGWLIFQAVSIKVFGTGVIALVLPGLFALATLILSVWWIGRSFHPNAGLIAAALLAFNSSVLQLASAVSPDLLMAAFATMAVGCIFYRAQRSVLFSLLAAVCFFLAFTTKLSVLYVAPWGLLVVILDIRKGKNLKFWGIFSGVVLALGISYLMVYHSYTGDAFYRWHGIQEEHHVSEWGYYGKSGQELLLRATIYPIAFILGSGALGYLLSLLLAGSVSKKLKQNPFVQFWGIFSILLLVVHWWGSTSFSSYNPVLLFDRMWLLFTPGLALLAAVVLWDSPKIKPRGRWLIVLFALAMFGAQIILGYRFSYFWLTGLVTLCWVIPANMRKYRIAVILVALGIAQFFAVRTANENSFFSERAFFEGLDSDKKVLIVSDSILYSKPLVHRGFNWPENHNLIHWHAWKEEGIDDWDEIWLIYNPERETIMSNYFGWPIPPQFRRKVGDGHKLVIRRWEE